MKVPIETDILLLSGYHAASHRYWCEQLVAGLSDYKWTQSVLPDRHFYWRMRSNALTYAFQAPELKADYDLVVATSMVDLCNLRGLLPHLCRVPTLLYFHENQFAYPQRKPNSNLINAQLTSLYSALVADRLIFNSEYNHDTFFSGAAALLKKMPDGLPSDLLADLPARSSVIPVPIQDELTGISQSLLSQPQDDPLHATESRVQSGGDAPIEIVWNHRWEYDKQPQVFFAAVERLLSDGVELLLHVMGQSFREVPGCFDRFRQTHGDCIATWGYQPSDVYRRTLQRADIVVSTALHDFQGLGMQEAIASGCSPVAPNRMAYPEYISRQSLYEVAAKTTESQEVESLYRQVKSVMENPPAHDPAHDPSHDNKLERYRTAAVLPQYTELFSSLL